MQTAACESMQSARALGGGPDESHARVGGKYSATSGCTRARVRRQRKPEAQMCSGGAHRSSVGTAIVCGVSMRMRASSVMMTASSLLSRGNGLLLCMSRSAPETAQRG